MSERAAEGTPGKRTWTESLVQRKPNGAGADTAASAGASPPAIVQIWVK